MFRLPDTQFTLNTLNTLLAQGQFYELYWGISLRGMHIYVIICRSGITSILHMFFFSTTALELTIITSFP